MDITHAERVHAVFSASSAEKWMNCPASINMEKKYPQSRNLASEEGTRAHEVAETALLQGLPTANITDDKEMARHTQDYVDYVMEICGVDGKLFTEERVSYNYAIEAPEGDGFGTCDNIVLENNNLHIIDFKYGHGEVSPVENKQLLLYAIGALSLFSPLQPIERVFLHIHQPRIGNIGSWETDLNYLMDFAEQAKEAVKLALEPNPKFNPTETGCKWCRARAHCKALSDQIEKDVLDDFDDVDVESLSLDDVARILLKKDLVLKFFKDLEQRAYGAAMQGQSLKGFKVVKKKSRAIWTDSAEAELQEKLGEDAYKKTLITITEAKKKLPLDEVLDLTIKKENGLDLVLEGDRRHAVDPLEYSENIEDDFDLFA